MKKSENIFKRIPHVLINGTRYKYCSTCDRYLEITANFLQQNISWDGTNSKCKVCRKKYYVGSPGVRSERGSTGIEGRMAAFNCLKKQFDIDTEECPVFDYFSWRTAMKKSERGTRLMESAAGLYLRKYHMCPVTIVQDFDGSYVVRFTVPGGILPVAARYTKRGYKFHVPHEGIIVKQDMGNGEYIFRRNA